MIIASLWYDRKIVQGEDQGQMFVNISPCDESGKCMGEEYFVEDSSELLGKPYHYKVSIDNCFHILK